MTCKSRSQKGIQDQHDTPRHAKLNPADADFLDLASLTAESAVVEGSGYEEIKIES